MGGAQPQNIGVTRLGISVTPTKTCLWPSDIQQASIRYVIRICDVLFDSGRLLETSNSDSDCTNKNNLNATCKMCRLLHCNIFVLVQIWNTIWIHLEYLQRVLPNSKHIKTVCDDVSCIQSRRYGLSHFKLHGLQPKWRKINHTHTKSGLLHGRGRCQYFLA